MSDLYAPPQRNIRQEDVIRIGILATHVTEEQFRLLESAKKRGHEASILKVHEFGLSIYPDNPKIYYDGEAVESEFDTIIPRIDIPYTEFGFKVLRQFQAIGVYTTDTAYSLELARSKLRCMQYLTRRGVDFPKTGFAYTTEGYKKIMSTIGGDSFIIKLNEGTQGIGVFLAEDEKQAKNFLRTFEQLDAEVMLQEFIGESAGTDLRCFVVGDKIVASMERKAQDDDFRANIALGGQSSEADLTDEEIKLALAASQAVGLNISGVDIIRSNRGPLVIEINSAPDFCGEWGLEAVSGVDVAEKIIEHAEQGKEKYDKGEGVWLQDPPVYSDATQ